MSSFAEALLWLGVIFPLVFSAGPGNILCAVAGATNGFRQSVPFILGLDLVYTGYALLAGFGMAGIFQSYPQMLTPVQILGSIYILWLGIKFLRLEQVNVETQIPKLRFRDGLVSQALNVKGMTIILTMYSQFLDSEAELVTEVLSLSLSLLLLNLATHLTWAYGGAWISRVLVSDQAIRIQSSIYGLMLVVIALWLLLKAF